VLIVAEHGGNICFVVFVANLTPKKDRFILRPSSFATIWVEGQKERIWTGYEVGDNKGESRKTRAINTKIGGTNGSRLGDLENNSGTRVVAGMK
jgi:hypothetical protein